MKKRTKKPGAQQTESASFSNTQNQESTGLHQTCSMQETIHQAKTILKAKQKVTINLKVTPKSNEQKITKILSDGTFKIKLRSTPENNKANEELILFLSEVFEIPAQNIHILKGFKSHEKSVELKTSR